ncbi:MAG: hypothetical protein K2X27_22520 [Candidatus Obscuribacterales bacterium]|nr:hypothetical protein [Candidatus Obscuribacterales bacterium]
MDKANRDNRPAPQQADLDWYSFSQGPGANAPTERQTSPQKQADDPYGYHQGPSGDKRQPHPGEPKPARGNLTLYDVAEQTLKSEGKKGYKQDDIYFRLNDLMAAHGFQKANLDGRSKINDHMLPRSWNDVDPRKLYDSVTPKPEPPKPEAPRPPKAGGEENGKDAPQNPAEQARAAYQKQLEAEIQEKYSLPPIRKGQGYFHAVAEAHPDWSSEKVLAEAKRIRHLNSDKTSLSVGERVSTLSKEEREQMIAKAMQAYDKQPAAPSAS